MFFCAGPGGTGEEFSDWSENDTDAELLNQTNEDRNAKNVRVSWGVDVKPRAKCNRDDYRPRALKLICPRI